MEFKSLRSFVTVPEQLSFIRSARLLHLSQSALTEQIQKLEEELGVQLLIWDRRSVKLTVGMDVEDDMTTLTNSSGHTAMILGRAADNSYSEHPKLVFDHSGQSYVLCEVQSTKLYVDIPVTK